MEKREKHYRIDLSKHRLEVKESNYDIDKGYYYGNNRYSETNNKITIKIIMWLLNKYVDSKQLSNEKAKIVQEKKKQVEKAYFNQFRGIKQDRIKIVDNN